MKSFKAKIAKNKTPVKEIENKRAKLKKENEDYGFKTIFKDCRIAALVGKTNCGKTNNIVYLIDEFRQHNETTNIYIYGFKPDVTNYLKNNYGCIEISSIKQLVNKKDCIFICDEVQKMKLNDRRYKDEVDEFKNFVYHNNVYALLSGPDIRMFNSVIGSIIEKWLLKSVNADQCINGSQLKKVVMAYNGQHKVLGDIVVDKSQIIVVNDDEEIILECPYVKEVDTKLKNESIF